MPVRDMMLKLLLHPLPTFYVIRAIIIETDILVIAAPGGIFGGSPFLHFLSAMRTGGNILFHLLPYISTQSAQFFNAIEYNKLAELMKVIYWQYLEAEGVLVLS